MAPKKPVMGLQNLHFLSATKAQDTTESDDGIMVDMGIIVPGQVLQGIQREEEKTSRASYGSEMDGTLRKLARMNLACNKRNLPWTPWTT